MSSGQDRGRPLGSGAGAKRKAEEDYSDNAHTKKSRQRIDKMTEKQKALDRSKKSINQQKSRKLKALRAKSSYISASADERAALEAREIQQVDARYSYNIVDDDEDEAWEDIPLNEIDEATQENLDGVEGMLNFDVDLDNQLPTINVAKQSNAIIDKMIQENQIREYQFFRDTWEMTLEILYIKVKRLNSNPAFTLAAMEDYGFIRPGFKFPVAGDIFTKEEVLLWFALAKYWHLNRLSKKKKIRLVLNSSVKKKKTQFALAHRPAIKIQGSLFTTAQRRYASTPKPSVKAMFSEISDSMIKKGVWELLGPAKVWEEFTTLDKTANILSAMDKKFSAILKLILFFLKLDLARDKALYNWRQVHELA
ncbi:uncharacterized protein CTRU02_210560 [Colletotrichum truncatum]|uniref:Uncharacterized protein n=1 Tax=Colletotrichum truncatum TaxID=5467 RepID=A0ACC3YPF9_COLTU|nr:uncharacterized protein CTRU02_12763 [Colletotrichum truncatum]KAF6784234.1 hypothetical protein CTRU02_12763 [Colletotrichum truncatum]